MTYDTLTTLSGDQVVLDIVVGNFYQVLTSSHGMDDFVFDLTVRAARHTTEDSQTIAQGVLPHLQNVKDAADAVKLLEAFVLTLRQQSHTGA